MTVAEIGAERVLGAGCYLGEGPVWDDRDGTLLFVDIEAGVVHRYDPSSGRDERFEVGGAVGSVGLRADGGLVIARGEGFVCSDRSCGALDRVPGFSIDTATVRFNDGEVDPWGRFVVGTMDRGHSSPLGSLYRLDVDGSVDVLVTGVTISNGLAWSADRARLYYVDSPTGSVDVFDVDPGTGEMGGRRGAFAVPGDLGMPDGLTLDAEGCLWVACFGGGRVCRFTPRGELDTVVRLPVSCVTSVAFGGSRLADLYVTTAQEGLDDGQLAAEPYAGDLFVVSPGVTGLAPARFGAVTP
ncbi:MAG: SMP-30/gluconolactonase/LRE family protein [Actinomycetota bacterium]|nr:SMP-30/gluconolactonase/LRE family protein [Actinomycetota bacterium]